jgi:2-polyprenyl-6-methoxyphenol hydroxylase-like FAD-dependent oxidoreductase
VAALSSVEEVVMQGSALVVGAGVAGLAVARGLVHAGWSVRIYERQAGLATDGTALGMWPSAMRVLDRLDAGSLVRSQAALQRGGSILRPDGSALFKISAKRSAYLISRRSLVNTLGSDLPAGTIQWGCPVKHPADLPDADVVIAADGIHSAVRTSEWTAAPRPLDTIAFRGTVPGSVETATETWGRGRIFGITPNSDHTTNWFACVRQTLLSTVDPDASSAETLHALYRTWHPRVATVLNGLDGGIDRRRLYDMPPLDTYVDGRIALVGDAAHAMAPNLGRGACEALIDADTLVDALSGAPDVESGLARYDSGRRRVTRRIVRLARALNRTSTATHAAPVRDAALTVLGRTAN